MRALLLLASALVASGCVGSPASIDAATSHDPASTAPAESVAFRYTMFNAAGRPLLTNQYATAVLMAAQDPSYLLLNSTEYVEIMANLSAENATPFGRTFEDYLRKGHAGETIITEVIPANLTITGTDGTTVALDRVHGPFPLTEQVSRAAFATKFPNASVGSLVQLNARYQAQVERMDSQTVTYRYSVSDGAAVPYPELGPNATLTTVVNETRGVFFDRIDIPLGEKFTRKNDRVLGLTHGHYFVQAVTDEHIVLGGLRSPMLDHAFEDVYFVVEIIRTS